MDPRSQVRVVDHISDKNFEEHYILEKKLYCRGDFFEYRQVRQKGTNNIFTAKIFRKNEINWDPTLKN